MLIGEIEIDKGGKQKLRKELIFETTGKLILLKPKEFAELTAYIYTDQVETEIKKRVGKQMLGFIAAQNYVEGQEARRKAECDAASRETS